jgi:hypothetical protein
LRRFGDATASCSSSHPALQEAHELKHLLNLRIRKRNAVEISELFNLGAHLVVRHGLGHVQHALELVNHLCGVVAANVFGEFAGHNQFLGANGFCK